VGNFPVADPRTGAILGEFPEAGPAEAADAVAALRAGLPDWSALDADTRAGYLVDVAKVLQARRDELAATIARESGRPLEDAIREVDGCVSAALDLAKDGPSWLDESSDRRPIAPIGVAAILTSSRHPLAGPFRGVTPALLAGNTVALKPARQGTLTALALRRAFEEAQLPRGVMRVVLGGPEAGRAVVAADVDVVACHETESAGWAAALASGRRVGLRVFDLEASGLSAQVDRATLLKFCALQGGGKRGGARNFLIPCPIRGPMTEGQAGLRQIDYEGIDPAVIHPSREVDELRGILLDARQRMWERYRALFALRAVGTDQAIAVIGRVMLSDSSALLRHECAFVFGQMADERCLPWLERSLAGDEHPMVRHEAAEALGAIAAANQDALAMLRHFAKADPAIEVRQSCEVALDNISYLKDPSQF
jgi:hypothetical protein